MDRTDIASPSARLATSAHALPAACPDRHEGSGTFSGSTARHGAQGDPATGTPSPHATPSGRADLLSATSVHQLPRSPANRLRDCVAVLSAATEPRGRGCRQTSHTGTGSEQHWRVASAPGRAEGRCAVPTFFVHARASSATLPFFSFSQPQALDAGAVGGARVFSRRRVA